MSITDKTRKILWARSGNRCSICKTELVKNVGTNPTIIGEECHIIGSKINSPRYTENININFDDYDNLLLLCSIHHKIIDENVELYSAEKLKEIKETHENEFRNTTNTSDTFPKKDGITLLPRLNSGKEIINIIKGAHAYEFDNDELLFEKEVETISGFFQVLQDLDLIWEFGKSEEIRTAFELDKIIHELEEMGFIIFGENKKKRVTNGKDFSDIWNIAIVYLLRKSNPNIINFNITNNQTTTL